MSGRDDDALRWDGDDDPTLEAGTAAPVAEEPTAQQDPVAQQDLAAQQDPAATADPLALPDGFTAVGKGANAVGHIAPDGTVTMPSEPAPMGNAALVTLGVLAGVYLLYTIGWFISGDRLRVVARLLVSDAAYLPAFVFAVAAPLLWFVTVVVVTRASAAWVRLALLVAGVVLLVPWPFVMVGAVGQ
ncbi:DNA polymerase III subunit gamma/tau [Microbacterium sp. No. 7]|uniref:DNA polymerase III subunit gamma/tau n=1 Tax=Microbacterium sp. No. 7 TaxID=1714373 RepID=UPI000AE8CB99|nr:DNA polymerase III subunit gamma/tau [Microbacterium sp. No. 7]